MPCRPYSAVRRNASHLQVLLLQVLLQGVSGYSLVRVSLLSVSVLNENCCCSDIVLTFYIEFNAARAELNARVSLYYFGCKQLVSGLLISSRAVAILLCFCA